MSHLKEACDFDFFYLLYADDLVFIIKYQHIERLIEVLF